MNPTRRALAAFALAAAAVSPAAAQAPRPRRVGFYMDLAPGDPEGRKRTAAFERGLQDLGWVLGRTLTIDYRWRTDDAAQIEQDARALVAAGPDVLVSASVVLTRALLRAGGGLPQVFLTVADPVLNGLVASLSKPGGAITGFTPYDYDLPGKWLETLLLVAPGTRRVAVLRDPASPSETRSLEALLAVAGPISLHSIDVRRPEIYEPALRDFAGGPDGGMIVLSGATGSSQRHIIAPLAAALRLPAVYPGRHWIAVGGLISYGPDLVDPFRRAASYVHRILMGERPADLPVQAPVTYDLVINLRAADALGLTISPLLLARADELLD